MFGDGAGQAAATFGMRRTCGRHQICHESCDHAYSWLQNWYVATWRNSAMVFNSSYVMSKSTITLLLALSLSLSLSLPLSLSLSLSLSVSHSERACVLPHWQRYMKVTQLEKVFNKYDVKRKGFLSSKELGARRGQSSFQHSLATVEAYAEGLARNNHASFKNARTAQLIG